MEKNKATYQRIVDYSADLMDKHFPKGECKERGKALVFNAELITYVMQELDRAMEEGYEECKKDMAVGVGLATDTELPEIVSKIASKLNNK